MARALLLLAFAALALASCGAAAQSSSDATNCTVSTLVSLDASYTFNEDDYIYVDGNFDQFDTCGQATNLVWTVNGVSDYGRYFYEPAASFGPGTYAGQLDVYLYADWSSDNATLAASYPFNVTVLNQTAPTPDAPSQSGSSGCIPSPTVVLESNYVYGAADYIYIDGDFSYFRMCDSTATLVWFVANATDNATAYNTTGWSFFAYPDTFAPGEFQGTLQVFLGDAMVPTSETAFGLTIVNGSAPTDAPVTEAPSSGSAGQCYPSPTVLLQPDYYFDVTSEVSIYGDYYYFQACEQTVSLVWAVGAQNGTGYGFWEPADTYAIGSYPGSLSVYFGDSGNETLVASYSFTVTIGNETAPVTDAPYTDAPWTDAPPAPCQPDYSVFLSENYWFAQTEDIVINPDLDFFETCGADYSLNWAVNGVRSTGLSFFEAAGSLALGEYEGSLDVVVNGSSVTTQSFNVTVYDGNSTALTAVAKVDRARAVSVLAAKLGAKKRVAKQQQQQSRSRKLAYGHKKGCCPKKLAARMQLQYSATTASTRVIRPDLRKMVVGCGTHPALVWRVGRAAVSTGRQLTLRAGAFAPGAYLASLEIHSGRTVVKHTFVVVMTAAAQKGAPVSAAAFKYHPEAKLQARLLGTAFAQQQQHTQTKTTSGGSSASKSTLIIAGAAGVSLVAVVAMGVALALRRRTVAPSRDAERQTLVQHA